MTLNPEHLIASKTTTQHAALEKLLTNLRIRRILKYVDGKVVLDFGSGSSLKALRAIDGRSTCRYGLDAIFKGKQPEVTADGIHVTGSFTDLKNLLDANGHKIDCIISLACFEHLEPDEFTGILKELHALTTQNALIVGTVPTPSAKPVLEFLSFKLGLIDPSQIVDHKVYYNKETLIRALRGTGWSLRQYELFQFGFNSFFEFQKI